MDGDDRLSALFRALTHPARLEILEALRDGEQCVCHIEAHLGYRQAYISQQLSVLREAGLIEDRRDGWNVFYRVTQRGVFDLIDHASDLTGPRQDNRRSPSHEQTRAVVCPCPKCSAKRVEAEARASIDSPIVKGDTQHVNH